MGLLTDENILNRKKDIRKKFRVGNKNILSGKKKNVGIFCVGFEGRKDQAKTSEGTFLEERYAIVKEPGAHYVDHVTPDDGSACYITEEIVYCIITTNSVAVERMVAVVTQAAELKTGCQSRLRTILNCILSRKMLLTFKSKGDWA